MKIIKIHLGFYLIIIAGLFLDFGQELLLSYAIIILHELAHIIAAGFWGARLAQIEILPFGTAAKFKIEQFKEKDEIIISMAGPLLNLCLLGLAFYYNNFFLISINLALLATNLLPILPLDGARALRAFLSLRWGRVKAFNTSKRLSQITIAFLSILAICILITNFNISLLIICAFLLVNFASECKNNSFIMLKSGILNEVKLKKQPLKTEVLTTGPDFLMCKLLKHFSGNNYYNVQIVENNKIIKTITEGEVINSLKTKGIREKILDADLRYLRSNSRPTFLKLTSPKSTKIPTDQTCHPSTLITIMHD